MKKLKKYKPTKFKAKNSKYSQELADYAVSFIECLCHTKGTWAGKPFELIDWQEQLSVISSVQSNQMDIVSLIQHILRSLRSREN